MLPLNNKRYASAVRRLLFKLCELYQFRTNKTDIRILLSKFLKYYQMNLESFLRLPQQEISNLITNYLVDEKKKISRQYKVVILSAIKHACEMNDVVLNWKKLSKLNASTERNVQE